MKAVTFAILAILVVAVSCRPDKPDLKQLKAEAARKKACTHDCASVALDPVCAGKQGDKPKSFANECVMNNFNCENKDNLKQLKAEARKKDYAGVALDPVCAGKQGDKPKSFANECVMNNFYCENKDTLHKISKGECPGSQGIRLS